jgi:hypothetical protein
VTAPVTFRHLYHLLKKRLLTWFTGYAIHMEGNPKGYPMKPYAEDAAMLLILAALFLSFVVVTG